MKKHEQFRATKISDISKIDIQTFIEEEIFDLWNDFGQKLDKEQISHICKRLFDVLSTKYRSWHVGTIHAVFQTGLNGGYGPAHKITVKTLFQWLGAAQKQLSNIKASQAEAESERNRNQTIVIDSPETDFLIWATKERICLTFLDPKHDPMKTKRVSAKITEMADEYQEAKEMDLLTPFKIRLKEQSLRYAEN